MLIIVILLDFFISEVYQTVPKISGILVSLKTKETMKKQTICGDSIDDFVKSIDASIIENL